LIISAIKLCKGEGLGEVAKEGGKELCEDFGVGAAVTAAIAATGPAAPFIAGFVLVAWGCNQIAGSVAAIKK
jgi:hypothetical protein